MVEDYESLNFILIAKLKKNKMKFKLLFLLLVTNFSILTAQNQTDAGVISGKVIDKNSKQPIPYVNVSVLENAKIITGGITQENGNFTIKNLGLKNIL